MDGCYKLLLPYVQAAQRGQAAAVLTRPEEGDALGAHYGDPPLIQSQAISGRVWHEISDITPELEGQKVRVDLPTISLGDGNLPQEKMPCVTMAVDVSVSQRSMVLVLYVLPGSGLDLEYVCWCPVSSASSGWTDLIVFYMRSWISRGSLLSNACPSPLMTA
jgi:hypothetical protein